MFCNTDDLTTVAKSVINLEENVALYVEMWLNLNLNCWNLNRNLNSQQLCAFHETKYEMQNPKIYYDGYIVISLYTYKQGNKHYSGILRT